MHNNEDFSLNDKFRLFSRKISEKTGNVWAFVIALSVIAIWIITGPIFNFSDTWQLVINTSTTIVTFLMVFIIQNTQNRDSKSIQIKLDELIKASRASNLILESENMSDNEIAEIEKIYIKAYQREINKRKEEEKEKRKIAKNNNHKNTQK